MKWFWISFFVFLSFLVVVTALIRPDTVDSTLSYVGAVLAVLMWGAVAAVFLMLLGVVIAGLALLWAFIDKRRTESSRQRDGSYPLQRHDPRKPAVWVDPNQMVGSAAAWVPGVGLIEYDGGAGWDNQRHVATARAQVARVQAALPGDHALVDSAHELRHHPSGPQVLRPRLGDVRWAERAASGWDEPKPVKALPASAVATPAPLRPQDWPSFVAPVAPLSLADALDKSDREHIVFGQSPQGEVATWNIIETPHMRLHGGTQKGKTSAAIAVVAGMLAKLHRVVILDPRGFKNWGIAGDWAELVDVRKPQAFVNALAAVHNEYMRRDQLLAEQSAKDILAVRSGLRPPRLLVVVEEYGAQRVRAFEAGTRSQVDRYLSVLASEAAATGIHVVAIDQRPTNYDPSVKANLGAVVIFNLPEGAGQASGYARAHHLQRFEFYYDGKTYRSIDAEREFRAAIGMRPVRYPPIITAQALAEPVHERSQPVHERSQPVHERSQPVHERSQLVHERSQLVHGSFMARSPEVDDTEPAVNAGHELPTSLDGWLAWTLDNYLPAHPELLQRDERGRGLGIKALAMAMAKLSRGSDEYEAFKGVASAVAKRIREETYLPGGAKLGVDVSNQCFT